MLPLKEKKSDRPKPEAVAFCMEYLEKLQNKKRRPGVLLFDGHSITLIELQRNQF